MKEIISNFFKHSTDLINTDIVVAPYGLIQILTGVFFVSIIVFVLNYAKKKKCIKKLQKSLAITLLLLEVSRVVWLISINKIDVTSNLPLHFCYFSSVIIFISVFFNNNFLMSFSYLYIMPLGIASLFMYDPKYYHFFSFAYIEVYVYHCLLVIIPLIAIVRGELKITIKHLIYSVIMFIMIAIILYIINILIGNGADYMFLVTVLNPNKVIYKMPFYPFFKMLMDNFSYFGSHLLSTLFFTILPVIGYLISKQIEVGENYETLR